MKQQHDGSRFAPTSGFARQALPGQQPGSAGDRFRQQHHHQQQQQQANLQSAARGGDPAALSQSAGRTRFPSYLDYGYTDSSFQGPALQADDLQYARDQQQQQQQQQRPSQQVPYAAYDPDMVYSFPQQGPAPNPYEAVPPYQARQSAAMEALSSQFGVPQYFPPNEPTGAGVPAGVGGSPYLAPQLQLSSYTQAGPIGRSSAPQPYPATMPDMTSTPVGATVGRLEQQQQQQQQPQPLQSSPSSSQHQHHHQPPPPPSQLQLQGQQDAAESTSLNDAYGQFQRALRGTFDHTRAGRLVEASRSLLEISEWLVTNARELGILRDDQVLYSDRMHLWNDFNICWLAICQKQKDLTQELLQTGRQPPGTSLLSSDAMDNLGKELIQLCDRIEQHGLVDYQMGIWEEEILCVLGQCLDIMERRPEIARAHTTTVPATATSRT